MIVFGLLSYLQCSGSVDHSQLLSLSISFVFFFPIFIYLFIFTSKFAFSQSILEHKPLKSRFLFFSVLGLNQEPYTC
jgi:hypothetical protein